MKSELYKKAINNIYDIVGQSVTKQIPTLDYIMGIEKMSDEDKIWYEAYKKYGNRNHTWQDFKNMFYGDINTMQKTVANWKTWDEINKLSFEACNQLMLVVSMMKKYQIKTLKDIEQYKDMYPDLYAEYKKYKIISETAQPNYATFNPEYSKLEREFERKLKTINADDEHAKKDLIVEYLQKMDEYIDLRNGDFVIGERIEIYREIILSNPMILMMAHRFDKLSGPEKVDLARMVLNESAKKTGTPTGNVIQDDATDGPHILKEKQGGGFQKSSSTFLFRSDVSNFSRLWNFLKTLAHEDAHRIDYYNPEYGMIGPQFMGFVYNYYMNNALIDESLYKKWATEQSSYYLDETTGAALEYAVYDKMESPIVKVVDFIASKVFGL